MPMMNEVHVKTEMFYAKQKRELREAHIEIVEAALNNYIGSDYFFPENVVKKVAARAVDALLDSGIVFTRMSLSYG